MTYQLPSLPYAYDALMPYIDERTIKVHHDKHHATYLANLNKALEGAPELQVKSAEELLTNLKAVPEKIRTAVVNNGGGFVNHNFYWESMAPNAGGEPLIESGIGVAIVTAFGNFAAFKDKFATTSVTRFGSGWGWLSLDKKKQLIVHSTANQDSPLSQGLVPLLTCDVWEHAYYLKYQNRRADYISAWWNVVNWAKIAERFAAAQK